MAEAQWCLQHVIHLTLSSLHNSYHEIKDINEIMQLHEFQIKIVF